MLRSRVRCTGRRIPAISQIVEKEAYRPLWLTLCDEVWPYRTDDGYRKPRLTNRWAGNLRVTDFSNYYATVQGASAGW